MNEEAPIEIIFFVILRFSKKAHLLQNQPGISVKVSGNVIFVNNESANWTTPPNFSIFVIEKSADLIKAVLKA